MDTSGLSQSELDAFNEGFEAAFNGADELMDNHYEHGTSEHLSWNDGYAAFIEQEESRRREKLRALAIESTDPILAKLREMPMEEVARAIGLPLKEWPGKCFAVASMLVRTFGWLDAEAVYGLYLGHVSPKCELFAKSEGAIRHGWVVTREGVLLDPTWWVFAAAKPALRVLVPGSDAAIEADGEYDEGAESLADLSRPFWPEAKPGEKHFPITGDETLAALNMELVRKVGFFSAPLEAFTAQQLSWLCRTPYSVLGAKVAADLYAQVEAHGQLALLPTDYRNRARRELRWGKVA